LKIGMGGTRTQDQLPGKCIKH